MKGIVDPRRRAIREVVLGAAQGEPLFGKTVRRRAFGGFVLTERSYPPGYCTPVHAHERPLFCTVLDGGYEEHHHGRVHRCTPATILFHAAGEEHLENFGESGGRSLIVEAQASWLERVCEALPVPVHTSALDGGSARLAGRRLYEEFLGGDGASTLLIEGLLLQLTGEFSRGLLRVAPAPPRWLADVIEFLQANYKANLSLAAIGREVGAHPVHVAQVFRRFQGCTIGEYLRKMRVDFACRELAAGDAPLARIAAESGFADQSHFARTFKALTRMSPSQYRTAARTDRPPAATISLRSFQ
jgi:AraC family transcriptional regulator